jgi:L-seryl-tRNA(Ser) seleniumtransferase
MKLTASLRKALPGSVALAVEDGESQVGSGAVPIETLPTKVLSLRSAGLPAEDLARRLRLLTPPVFARIHKDAVLLDLRTIQPDEDAFVLGALTELLK